MHAKKFVLSAAMLLVATVCLANPPSTPADETQAVEQATAQFYTSLNKLFTGDTAPMQEIWSHEDDVIYMGPRGGIQVGWNDVRANWEAQAALKLSGQVEPLRCTSPSATTWPSRSAMSRVKTWTPKAGPTRSPSAPPIFSARKTASGK